MYGHVCNNIIFIYIKISFKIIINSISEEVWSGQGSPNRLFNYKKIHSNSSDAEKNYI